MSPARLRVAFVLFCTVALLWPDDAAAGGGKLAPEKKAFLDAVKASAPAAAPTDGQAQGKLGTARMRKANQVASEIVKERMNQRRPSDLKLLREAGEADVVVVQGGYDRVQDVLKAMDIKHVVVPPHLVERLPLMSTQTLMVNCPGRLTGAGVKKVRRFVRTGGFLVTTDWALTLLQKAFPGFVKRGKRNTRNDVVKVKVLDEDQPFLRQVRAAKEAPRWWLEGASYPIHVLDKQRVKVLITSREMKRKYGHAPIAVSFRYHDGKVLHMTSHFYLQQAKLRAAREKAKGSSFAKAAGLSSAQVKKLKDKGVEVDQVKAGELNSACSMQQVTANVVVAKQKDNKQLLSKYGRRAKRAVKLDRSASRGKGAGSAGQVGKAYRLRELKRKGSRVKVRDLFGNEGWVDEAALE